MPLVWPRPTHALVFMELKKGNNIVVYKVSKSVKPGNSLSFKDENSQYGLSTKTEYILSETKIGNYNFQRYTLRSNVS